MRDAERAAPHAAARCRYASLFDTQTGLSLALEESKSLVMVAVGCRGIAPLHAALTWTPVQVGMKTLQ